MKSILSSLFCLLLSTIIFANPLEDIWKAIEKNNRQEARNLLEKALKNKATKTDAAMILMLLNSLDDKAGNIEVAKKVLPDLSEPNPYLYALWYDSGFLNSGITKSTATEKHLLALKKDKRLNETLQASLDYALGLHYSLGYNFEKSNTYWNNMGALDKWQFTGAFDNTSGSGFNKKYKPIQNAMPNSSFIAKGNFKVNWFVPKTMDSQPWIGTNYYIPDSEGIVYAQTFVDSPKEQELIFATGFTGSMKIWVNDKLVIQNEEELRTDVDYLKSLVKIPAGTSRILVQLGYTSKSGYPNFLVRTLDKSGNPVVLPSSTKYSNYPKGRATIIETDIPHFAEAYFEAKIKSSPDQIINHLLLSKVYHRSNRFNEAIAVLKEAQKKHSNNSLIQTELLYNYHKLDDRTEISKAIEALRKNAPDLCFFAIYDYMENEGNKDYAKCEENLEQLKDCQGADSEDYYTYYIKWLNAKKEYQKLIEVAEEAYSKYPKNTDFLSYKFNILNAVKEQPKEAIALMENYLAENYNYTVYKGLKDEYAKQKNTKKVEEILLKLYELYPANSEYIDNLLGHYYRLENYEKALEYVNIGIKNTPYRNSYWSDRAYINESLKDRKTAIRDFKRAITYNQNAFDAREKLREFEGRPALNTLIYDKDRVAIIKNKLQESSTSDENYEYLFYDKSIVLYPEGAFTKYFSSSWQILSEAGIDKWKEASISYNNNKESLVIEKAEVYKKNGEKLKAERNRNEFVFTSLEIGDIIHVEYRINHYKFGNLAKEFWTKHAFNDFVPITESRYRIFASKDYPLHFEAANLQQQATKKEVDDFICYEWLLKNPAKCKDENYMPTLSEAGMTLSVSSINSWDRIANWYSDLAVPQAREDHNLEATYQEIFAGKNLNTDLEKAKAIYEYIANNINYSSVSFRQSNYVPQKPMVTISTRLGDCKDVSTLYHTLAQKAGLSTNLVLVNTRDNGEKAIALPSIEFNHCIIKIDLPEGPLFQELTDNDLPFGAMPNIINNAQALVIPNKANLAKPAQLINIPYTPLIKSSIKRTLNARVAGDDLTIATNLEVVGNSVSGYRGYFSDLTKEQTKENVNKAVGQYFESTIDIKKHQFSNLDNLGTDLSFETDFVIKNAVLAIGGIKAIKPPFMEKIFSIDPFAKEERSHPLLYWKYEDNDAYDIDILLELPVGSKVIELPENFAIKTGIVDYQLSVKQEGENKVRVIRTAKLNRAVVSAADYKAFKTTIEQILKAEDFYIAFK